MNIRHLEPTAFAFDSRSASRSAIGKVSKHFWHLVSLSERDLAEGVVV